MGTNYYARINPCKLCGHADEVIHIGKSSIGWTFSFHATDTIKSYKDWIEFLSRDNIYIFDEYDEKVSLFEFKELVKSKKSAKLKHAVKHPEDSFLDKEGHSFTNGDFS